MAEKLLGESGLAELWDLIGNKVKNDAKNLVVEKITTSGTWTAPADLVGKVKAYVFGAGGGGG